MFFIGSHISSAKGYLAMGKEAVRIGANTFQFFTRNPRGSRAKALNHDDIAAFLRFAEEHPFGPLLAHASYTLNPAATEESQRTFTRDTIIDDLRRLEYTPGNYYNLHPGRHPHPRSEEAVQAVAATLDAVLKQDWQTGILLETMSGHGSEMGGRFEDLKAILEAAGCGDRVGVCLDTCHVFDAGYDIVGELDLVLTSFDRILGLDRLKAVHLNDSKNPLGSGKDRHAKIGEGFIGLQGFARIINHPALRNLPFTLETPNDGDGHALEIAQLKSMYAA